MSEVTVTTNPPAFTNSKATGAKETIAAVKALKPGEWLNTGLFANDPEDTTGKNRGRVNNWGAAAKKAGKGKRIVRVADEDQAIWIGRPEGDVDATVEADADTVDTEGLDD